MITLENIAFRYPGESFELFLDHLEFTPKSRTAVVGPSGCGKTTLLRLISGILVPHAGGIRVDGTEIQSLAETKRRAFRIRTIGLLFQEFELLDYLTALDNILLPCRISSVFALNQATRDHARELAAATGIESLLHRYPDDLSHGERQRVGLCRALIAKPKLILADEPTGSLDPENQKRIVSLLSDQARANDATLVMVTHDHSLLDAFDRTVDLPALLK